MINEADDMTKLLVDKTLNPDQVIECKGVMKATYDNGDRFWFITEDNKVIQLNVLDEEADEDKS